MHIKWRIYFLTLVAYAVVHSLRTMWSAIKSDLSGPPFNYEVTFLGAIDMLVLFVIAICMNILGPKVEVYGPKKCLVATLAALLVFNTLVGILLNLNITSQWLYVIFFGFGVGVSSSTAWPACLYMVSLYFDKRNGINLSAWNGTSQLGDFISLITFFAIVATNSWPPQSSFFLASAYLLVMLLLIIFLIPKEMKSEHSHPHGQKPTNVQNIELQQENVPEEAKPEVASEAHEGKQAVLMQSEEKKLECMSEGSEGPSLKQSNKTEEERTQVQAEPHKKVNFLTVWLLPGVALNVLSYGFIKSVNVFIVSWMVFYLITLDLGSEAVLVTLLWSASVFVGGILCAIINKKLRKIFFVFQLVGSTIAFILLESFHLKVYETEIIVGIVVCALFYGGPFSLMSTAIPIALGNQQQVNQYQNGKSAIISLVQGYGLFFSGISLILMPAFGISNINIVGAAYCMIAALLLLGEIYRTRSTPTERSKQAKQIMAK